MRTTHFSEYQLPGPAGKGILLSWLPDFGARPGPALPHARDWQDELTRHQTFYDELLASPEWLSQAASPSPAPRRRALSVRELTRDLPGWSLPQTGRYPAANS